MLERVNEHDLAAQLMGVAAKIKGVADESTKDEELFANAPDAYLDALLSHLMTDPVRLPASGQVVDRSTIARHILSDQTDPFSRDPLTMDLVVPLDGLRDEIRAWMDAKRKEAKS